MIRSTLLAAVACAASLPAVAQGYPYDYAPNDRNVYTTVPDHRPGVRSRLSYPDGSPYLAEPAQRGRVAVPRRDPRGSYGGVVAYDPMDDGEYDEYGQSTGRRSSGRYDDGVARQAAIPREEVEFDERYAPGTIVVNSRERRLYLVTRRGEAIRYGVGVGRPGFGWTGTHTVTRKREWPDWTPPAEMLKRRPDLPRYMEGGIENPLGARALYLGSSLYRIHGSNEPESIGMATSSGCIRMTNADVVHLFERVKVGTKVIVL